ncbi:M20/M25/M40 family metallo-hydrolase [Polycladidibacter hongkongensis]|uniref:M20/M25/M40 family metallo-hydrolase n=1 Tax=Polycladidibacter hongkongensis TaxID=1647556 RepID=UPI00082FC65C|nr:M20/M25/M40 family metallo-hydrolase [Pseudovibrio hongkongensis]
MDAAIEGRFDEQVAFLQKLVQAPSDNPAGDTAAHAELSAKLIEAYGFDVERLPVPEPFVRQHGMISACNLIVRHCFGDGQGPVIALNAHGDVVPPGEGWTKDPYGGEVQGGALYGRGAAVSKSDFATYLFALLALRDNGDGLNGTVELHLTYDEEAGGFIGPKWLLEQGHCQPDLAIAAGFSYAITTAHNGCLHMEVIVRGKQAHAAMPESGADALEGASYILGAVYAERKRLARVHSPVAGIGSPTITVGLISGGINTNVVPDRVCMRIDRRLVPEEHGEQIEASLEELLQRAVPPSLGLEVECRRIMLAEPLRALSGAQPLVEALSNNARDVLGVDVQPNAVPLYTDARHYAGAGVPTVLYGAGPRSILEAGAHGADEHVELADLMAATKVIARTLRDLLA